MNVQIYATIITVLPRQRDAKNDITQRLILNHVTSTNGHTQVSPRLILQITCDPNITIPFAVGDPITVKGDYDPSTNNPSHLPTVSNAHSPNGFIRYMGKVYV